MQKFDKKKIIQIVSLVIFIVVMLAATIFAIPLIKMLITDEGRGQLASTVKSYGALAPVIFVGLQIVQVVIALIPGEPFEIVAGILFGSIGGFILCLIGVMIGTVIVFYLVKLIGQPIVSAFVDNKKINNLKILNNEKNLETLIFILFLIPGTPKDAITYVVPLTKIKPMKYFILATLARIPAILSSTIVGSTIESGNWVLSVVIFIITGIIGLLGIFLNDKLMKRIRKSKKTDE